ncbi:hypothetical protein HGI30_13930 [Paenibacillus albicereus]|uniref:Uncharacterized protein n=1 Tax=Paenibacillus albicereus TaxID=2726185 RepID=A0A6H2GYS3_9BACL|nr:hypothetical protein [Paenibacillus albicereus]QJC52555.1 hypothetical protein HGI30_13930 [Paenibacillus albicereus]
MIVRKSACQNSRFDRLPAAERLFVLGIPGAQPRPELSSAQRKPFIFLFSEA